ncbi:MAG: sulfatase-like hydrolase/transferase [Pirellulaceae bacterium]
MNWRPWLIVPLVASGVALGGPPADRAVERPNVVVILIDNCGQEWLGCYGSEEGCTPHLDQLARDGLRVENCYTPPVCGPSRIVALTGRYLLRSGMTLHHDAALYGGGGLDPQREWTFARLLREAGYRTAIAGKWQINNLYDEPQALRDHGFEESLVWPGSIDADRVAPAERAQFDEAVRQADVAFTSQFISRIESRYWDPVLLRNGVREVHPGKFGPNLLHEFAAEFVRRQEDRPFLLYYPLVLTHGQTFTAPVVATPLNRDPDRDHHAMYADMVRYADRLIGELMHVLERAGQRERTVVFIATDNGTEKSLAGRRDGRPVTGGLYQLSEAGGNVGLVVHGPGRVRPGTVLPLADFSDLLPTIAALAGVSLPRDRVFDGVSFARALSTGRTEGLRTWIFNQYGADRVVRDERFKLYADGRLFDVRADRGESHPLDDAADPEPRAARRRLQHVLDALPPDSPPPFELRSQSAFKLKQQQQQQQQP